MKFITDSHIKEISAYAFMAEEAAVKALLANVEPLLALETIIAKRAKAWTQSIRAHKLGHGVEALLHSYGLDTNEGIALMCLSEALLRIPDAVTADALIRDTFEGRDWQRYIGSSDSWTTSMSNWALLLTGTIIDFGYDTHAGLLHTLKNTVAKLGEPVIREALKKAMRLLGSQFVLGETVQEALAHSQFYLKQGYRFSFDILGEGARSDAQAKATMQLYREGIALIGKAVNHQTPLLERPGISVKLSALHARCQLTQYEYVEQQLLPRLKEIITCAKQAGITVSIDAEESSKLDLELLLFKELLADPSFAGWNGIGFVVQAYQKRAFYIVDWLASLASTFQRIIPVRLVKGAYWDSEIKWAQLLGLPSYPVFTRKEHTDLSYLACADKLLKSSDVFYPQFATHNARTAASVMAMAEHYGCKRNQYEFQRLHGMGESLHDIIVKDVPSRIYAPVGAHKDLLAYLIRRLLENGANSSFVHLLMDQSKTPEEILVDPIAQTKAHSQGYNPHIALPLQLYGKDRKNSAGIDFGNLAQLQLLEKEITPYLTQPLPSVADITVKVLDESIASACKASAVWAATNVAQRAAILERTADLIEEHSAELIALCACEAGKTLKDGVSEIREAVDFCRYYASQARILFAPQTLAGPVGETNVLSLQPRGVFACISPWNFPLAIFIGQVTAALVTGNSVIAKPAEQTSRIAKRAVELLYEAGIPRDVLYLASGNGESIGAELVADRRISGVVFTGGTDTALHIQQALATRGGPIVPLIAETGGQNCMVVDSSALIEQAIDDIILSAFGSAGQRCSALRVLYVQEDIAGELLTMLAGAMEELVVGSPLDLATDIGPVIDVSAQEQLLKHIQKMKGSARFIAAAPVPKIAGCFVAPHAFEIKNIGELTAEIFGPVLHVIRFKAGTLPQVADAINSTGYGLTFGIHSRVDENIHLLSSRVRAGNIYVNRSMIGATVGVQPFGGEGLSGTGPKAGGPHYLARFITERTITINTAAIGGNTTLLAS